MNALVKGACAVAVLAALEGPTEVMPVPTPPPAGPAAAPRGELTDQPLTGCRRHSLPLGPVAGAPATGGPRAGLRCLPLPPADRAAAGARARRIALAPKSEHVLRTRAPQDLIPRLPDRPEPFADYQLPVDPVLSVTTPGATGPLDGPPEPDARLGVVIEGEPGAPVTLVDLEGSSGRPEVVLVGHLEGVTVVIRQQVQGPAGLRDYLVVYGHLGRPGPSIVNGARLGPMAVIGTLSDEEADAQLYLEVRMERGAMDRPTEHLSQLVSDSVSVAVDPRNVLPHRK